MFGLGEIIKPAINMVAFRANSAFPTTQLNPSDLSRLWTMGLMSDEQFRILMKGQGVDTKGWDVARAQISQFAGNTLQIDKRFSEEWDLPWQAFFRSQSATPTPEQLNTMFLRGYIDKVLYTALMKMNGYTDQGLITAFFSLREDIPVVQDLIRFAVRESFDPAIISKYGYADDIPDKVIKFAAAQGLGGPTGEEKPKSKKLGGGIDPARDATWSDMYWFAHWELPSPTMGYEMMHRLYPASPHGPSPEGERDTWFDDADLNQLLKAQDYPTFWRDRLAALSFRPLGRIDVRRMFKMSVLTEDDTYHAYRAMGYSDRNSELLLKFTIAETERTEGEGKLEVQKAKICTFYKQGILDREQARTLLAAIKISPIGTETFLNSCDLDMKADHIKAMEENIKEAFMLGGFDTEGLRIALMNLGISIPVVNNKVEEWEFERIVNRKEPSAQIMKGWYKDGLITDDELTARMQNLNYESIYITNMLIQADREISADRFKSQEKEKREAKRQVREARLQTERTARDQYRTHQDQIRGMLASSSEKNLKVWLQRGIITPQQAAYRLRLKGWPMEDVSRWMTATDIELTEEMQEEIEKEIKDAAKESAKE